jgi:hypothetical protein
VLVAPADENVTLGTGRVRLTGLAVLILAGLHVHDPHRPEHGLDGQLAAGQVPDQARGKDIPRLEVLTVLFAG